MRVVIRTSRAAVWARRFASLAFPLSALALAMHYGGAIDETAFAAAAVLGTLLAALGLLVSLYALVSLWFTGDLGWGRAFGALLVSLLCLLPGAAAGWALWHYPPGADIATSAGDPPVLVSEAPEPPRGPETPAIARAYPGLRGRRYPLDAPQVFALVAAMVDDRGWPLLQSVPPVSGLDTGEINAIATALGGWRDEVAIRVRGDGQGAVVDMRSAALASGPDFGANGRRVETFLGELDSRVAEALRAAPANVPEDNAAPDITEVPRPAPPPGPRVQGAIRPGAG